MSQATHVQKLLARAQAVLAQVAPRPEQDDVEKRIIRSPAGKRYVVKWLLPLIPPHRCYVEPFAGSAALFFAKEPAPEEVLNDRDPDIAFAYRFVQRMTPDTLDELKRLHWKNSRPYFEKLKDKKPANDLERFHKFIYLNRFSYFSKPGRFASYNPGEDGQVFRAFDKFIKGKERLAKTIIRTGDYEKVIREFDGPDTFFFLDPPFPGYDQSVGESEFDEVRFVKVLHEIRGKFLVTYGLKSDRSLFDRFQVRRVMVPTATPTGLQRRPLLFIANYSIKKSLTQQAPQRPIGAPSQGRHVPTARRHGRTPPREEPRSIEKGIWGSSAGKAYLAKRIVELIPKHRIYVEPFAGGAQVLFAKEPSEIEVVSDIDPEVASAFQFVRDMTDEQLAQLRRKSWEGNKDRFRKLRDAPIPADPVERFYRFAYLTRFSFNKLRRGTMPSDYVGAKARLIDRLEQSAPRLRRIEVRCADYEQVIDEFDGPETFFFLDPPYAGYNAGVQAGAGYRTWDEERFGQVLRRIQGTFLVTYGIRGAPDLFKGFHEQRWRHVSGVGAGRGQGKRPSVTLVVTNYKPGKQDKSAKPQPPMKPQPTVAKQNQSPSAQEAMPDPTQDQAMAPFYKRVVDLAQPIIKRGSEEERFTLGIVLEPDVVDAQNDRYSKEEVRRACHRFAEFYLNAGLMHRELANGRIVILENYLAPCDFVAENGEHVKEGTWLQGRRYRDDEIWQKIKNGELTGLSIGGSAIRRPAESTENTIETKTAS